MQKKENLNGGYAGLIMLMITVAIMALIIVRTDLFTGEKVIQEEGQEGVQTNKGSMLERGFDAVDQAKEAKALMEKNNVLYEE